MIGWPLWRCRWWPSAGRFLLILWAAVETRECTQGEVVEEAVETLLDQLDQLDQL